jgi:hypothetical protein
MLRKTRITQKWIILFTIKLYRFMLMSLAFKFITLLLITIGAIIFKILNKFGANIIAEIPYSIALNALELFLTIMSLLVFCFFFNAITAGYMFADTSVKWEICYKIYLKITFLTLYLVFYYFHRLNYFYIIL